MDDQVIVKSGDDAIDQESVAKKALDAASKARADKCIEEVNAILKRYNCRILPYREEIGGQFTPYTTIIQAL